MESSTRSNRIPSYELLRVIAMGMVLCLHCNYQYGALADTANSMTPTRVMGGLLESLAIVAVNVYVLISGYFLSRTQFKLSRLVRLLCQILFYTLLIPAVLSLFHIQVSGTDLWSAVFYFLPVSMNHYWFVTSYVFLVLLSPVLNAAADHLTRRQLKGVLLLLLFFTSALPSLSPVQLNTDTFGYDFSWFLVLYLTAAYLRRCGMGRLAKKRNALCWYLASCFGIFLLYLGLHLAYERTGSLAWYMQVPFHYNFLLVYTASLGFFALFHGLALPERGPIRALTALAPYTFGVYLIHQHVDVKDRWAGVLQRVTGAVSQTAPFCYLLQMLAAAVILFAVCAAIDWMRAKLFALVGRGLGHTRLSGIMAKADGIFAENEKK